jgi:glycosyltransferase involved in cell wall biosynthesis
MTRPLSSIIVAAYNRQRYVGTAVKSILAQTRSEIDLIVWDDGSTDDTLRVAREAAGDDPRVRFVHEANQGQPSVLLQAGRLARGDYIGWLDSDDVLAPTAVEETAAILDARPEVGMVYTRYMTIDADNHVGQIGNRCLIPYSKDRLLLDFMTFHFRLFRRSIYQQVGEVDTTLGAAEDYDLCMKFSEVTEIEHIPKPLYLYRVHDDAMSSQTRLKQIMAAQKAIANALKRRGMNDVEVHVELVGKFSLRKKPGSSK